MYLCGCHVLSVPDAAIARLLLLLVVLVPTLPFTVAVAAAHDDDASVLLSTSADNRQPDAKRWKKKIALLYTSIFIKYVCALTKNAVPTKSIRPHNMMCTEHIFHFHYSFPFRIRFHKLGENVSGVCILLLL